MKQISRILKEQLLRPLLSQEQFWRNEINEPFEKKRSLVLVVILLQRIQRNPWMKTNKRERILDCLRGVILVNTNQIDRKEEHAACVKWYLFSLTIKTKERGRILSWAFTGLLATVWTYVNNLGLRVWKRTVCEARIVRQPQCAERCHNVTYTK